MPKRYLKLDDLPAYTIASELSDDVWHVVASWEWFAKRTLGSQFVDAIDSIGANIAEGFGRFHKKDKQKFYYNARGSVYESAYWTRKAKSRGILIEEKYIEIMDKLRKLPKEINTLIKITNNLSV